MTTLWELLDDQYQPPPVRVPVVDPRIGRWTPQCGLTPYRVFCQGCGVRVYFRVPQHEYGLVQCCGAVIFDAHWYSGYLATHTMPDLIRE